MIIIILCFLSIFSSVNNYSYSEMCSEDKLFISEKYRRQFKFTVHQTFFSNKTDMSLLIIRSS